MKRVPIGKVHNILQREVKGYKADHPNFPDQPTSDQFFDERQFAAYRELGYRTAIAMIDDAALEEITLGDAENEGIRETFDLIQAFCKAGPASSNPAG